ncbi:hypothetical protein XANCAGTX0491_009355 [Xanthoria calcicola]
MYISHPWFTILYFLFFRLVHSIPAQPITRPLPLLLPNALFNFSLANSGLGYGPIPDGFSLRPDMQFPRPMSESATLINIAHAIKQLGQGDIQGEVLPRDFATARYPEPVIAVRVPPSRRTLKRQYVISALILAMMHMLSLDQPTLRWSHYTLLWHGEEIGGLAFGIYSPPLLDGMAQNATSTQKRAEPQVNSDIVSQESNQAVAITTTGVTNNRLSVALTYLGPGLEKTDLLSTLILVMAQAAVPPSEERFANWVPDWLEGHTRFLASAAAGRTSPPYMTYYWLLDALEQTADYLVDHNRYGDVRMVISVDGRPIGQGLFRHR